MEYLIVGLGNPGLEYKDSRHNIGFMCVDFLVENIKLDSKDFTFNKAFNSNILKYNNILFLKPDTFMNNSGYAVSRAVNYYKFDKIYIVYDDLDLNLGDFKIGDKYPKTHNGVMSIKEQVNNSFISIRIGIDNNRNINIPGIDYVLGKISREEKLILNGVFSNILTELKFL